MLYFGYQEASYLDFTIVYASSVLNAQYVWELKKKGTDSVLLSKLQHKNMLICALKKSMHNFLKIIVLKSEPNIAKGC